MLGTVSAFAFRKRETEKNLCLQEICGLGGSVGIAIDYGLDGAGSNPGGDEIFHPSRPALSCKMGTGSFPGVKCGRGVLLTTHPPSNTAVMKE